MPGLPASAAPHRHVSYARYVARTLSKRRKTEQARRLRAAADTVQSKARAVEDQEALVFELRADRDLGDQDLDRGAKGFRHKYAGQDLEVAKQATYQRIFPDGIAYYTAAGLDEQVPRYTQLRERIATHLPDDEPLKAPTLAAIDAGLAAWKEAVGALNTAQRTLDELKADLEQAEAELGRLIEKTWGALIDEEGEEAARTYFPRR